MAGTSASAWSAESYHRDNMEEEFSGHRAAVSPQQKSSPLDELFKKWGSAIRVGSGCSKQHHQSGGKHLFQTCGR
jgi:hypothetical protein